mmetsp:Transcript_8636/g.20797  ORF Transcript_8636/g.20797 Transcript_8636/m.20797 type:complete len:395 (-) Transcript_8636:63-1247(-)
MYRCLRKIILQQCYNSLLKVLCIGKRPKNSDDFDNCESVRKKQFTKSGKSRDKGRVEGETCKNQLNLRPPPGSKEKSGNCRTLKINRSPVMKIWAATLAERTSFSWAEGLSLGGTVAGLNAQTKGRSIGIYKQREDKSEEKEEKRKSRAETETVQLLGRRIPVVRTNDGRVLGKAPKPRNMRTCFGVEACDTGSLEKRSVKESALNASYTCSHHRGPPEALPGRAWPLGLSAAHVPRGGTAGRAAAAGERAPEPRQGLLRGGVRRRLRGHEGPRRHRRARLGAGPPRLPALRALQAERAPGEGRMGQGRRSRPRPHPPDGLGEAPLMLGACGRPRQLFAAPGVPERDPEALPCPAPWAWGGGSAVRVPSFAARGRAAAAVGVGSPLLALAPPTS